LDSSRSDLSVLTEGSDLSQVEQETRANQIGSPISYIIGIITNFIASIYFIPQLLLKSVKIVALSQFLL
jgi:hypothetical protein